MQLESTRLRGLASRKEDIRLAFYRIIKENIKQRYVNDLVAWQVYQEMDIEVGFEIDNTPGAADIANNKLFFNLEIYSIDPKGFRRVVIHEWLHLYTERKYGNGSEHGDLFVAEMRRSGFGGSFFSRKSDQFLIQYDNHKFSFKYTCLNSKCNRSIILTYRLSSGDTCAWCDHGRLAYRAMLNREESVGNNHSWINRIRRVISSMVRSQLEKGTATKSTLRHDGESRVPNRLEEEGGVPKIR